MWQQNAQNCRKCVTLNYEAVTSLVPIRLFGIFSVIYDHFLNTQNPTVADPGFPVEGCRPYWREKVLVVFGNYKIMESMESALRLTIQVTIIQVTIAVNFRLSLWRPKREFH